MQLHVTGVQRGPKTHLARPDPIEGRLEHLTASTRDAFSSGRWGRHSSCKIRHAWILRQERDRSVGGRGDNQGRPDRLS